MSRPLIFTLTLLATTHAAAAFSNPILTKVFDTTRQSYSRGERPFVVFEIDGPLLDDRARTLQILREYSDRDLKTARPELAKIIAGLTVANIKPSLGATLAAAGITEEAVVNNASVFWSQRFFDEDYMKHDTANPAAVRFVRELYSAGARIVYVSSRDAQRQLVGTIKTLRDSGFPVGIQGSEVILRPVAQLQEPVFRQQLTSYLRLSGKPLAVFDSEPSSANIYRRAFDDATCVIYGRGREPNPPPLLPNIIAISAFE